MTGATATTTLEQRIAARLAELESQSLLRTLNAPQGIDLTSNDYLGLSVDARLKQRMAEAVRENGCGSTGSRLLRGERRSFSAVERKFAAFKGAEASLFFSSGYAANLAALSTFLDDGDVVYSDRLNHASLIDGMKLGRAKKILFHHTDLAELRRLLSAPAQGQRFLVTESVFSMDGDLAPLREYASLCRASGTALIVDEAHAVGIYGPRGSGLIEETGIGDDVFLSVNPVGKALGVGGAFVAGGSAAIQYLVQRARQFIFSTAPPPSMAAALDEALEIIEHEPERRRGLLSLAAFMRRLLSDMGLPVPSEGLANHPRRSWRQRSRSVDRRPSSGSGFRCARDPAAHGSGRHGPLAYFDQHELERGDPARLRLSTRIRSEGVSRRMTGVFVTGTDTNIGKTIVSAALMHRCRSFGAVRYWKPIQTGAPEDDDTTIVAELGQCSEEELLRAGIRLPRPLSPHLSARLAGAHIALDEVLRMAPIADARYSIVEGAGGVLVPLNESCLMIDLIAALQLPAVIVARSGLGTINHTLLTLEALRARAIAIAGVVLVGEPNPENCCAIETHGNVAVLGEMPKFDSLTPSLLRSWATSHLDPEGRLA